MGTKNKEQSAKADRGGSDLEANREEEESGLERVKADERGESTVDHLREEPASKSTGLPSQKYISSQLATRVTAEKVVIFFEVQLQGRESKDYSITLKSKSWFAKAMKAVASRLEKEVSSLRFLVSEGPCEWRRLVGMERASELAGATVVVRDAQ